MNWTRRFTPVCLLAVLVMVTPVATAQAGESLACTDISPAKKNGVDLLTEQRGEPLIPGERKALLKLFKSLRGHWRGTYQLVQCLETAEGVERKLEDAQVFVQALWAGHNRLLLESDSVGGSDNTRIKKQLDLYLSGEFLRINTDREGQELLLLEASPTQLKAYRRYRVYQRFSKQYFPIETGFAIHLKGRSLTIRKVSFTRGVLAGVEIWRLRR